MARSLPGALPIIGLSHRGIVHSGGFRELQVTKITGLTWLYLNLSLVVFGKVVRAKYLNGREEREQRFCG